MFLLFSLAVVFYWLEQHMLQPSVPQTPLVHLPGGVQGSNKEVYIKHNIYILLSEHIGQTHIYLILLCVCQEKTYFVTDKNYFIVIDMYKNNSYHITMT